LSAGVVGYGRFKTRSRSSILAIARCAKRAVAIQLDYFVAALLAMTGLGCDFVQTALVGKELPRRLGAEKLGARTVVKLAFPR
jgi:hypothetical protein